VSTRSLVLVDSISAFDSSCMSAASIPAGQLDPLDDRAVIDTNKPTPYLDTQHPVLLPRS